MLNSPLNSPFLNDVNNDEIFYLLKFKLEDVIFLSRLTIQHTTAGFKVSKFYVLTDVNPSNYKNLIDGQGPILLAMDARQVCVCVFTS